MQALKFGTISEQRRYEAGWLRSSEIERDQEARCGSCLHAFRRVAGGKHIECLVMGAATGPRCWCRHHVAWPPLLKREVVL